MTRDPAPLPWLDVLIDGACPLCRRTARLLHRLDWLHRLNVVDADNDALRAAVAPGLRREEALAAMHVRHRRSGRLASGYDGCVELARALPALWVALPFMVIPGVSVVGRRMYRRIAGSRSREGRCVDDRCSTR